MSEAWKVRLDVFAMRVHPAGGSTLHPDIVHDLAEPGGGSRSVEPLAEFCCHQ